MTYDEAVELLNSSIGRNSEEYMKPNAKQDWFLERTRHFFEKLGHPEQGFRYMHIAGSSGKGSSAMMAGEVLHRAGEHVGVYTSPYVTTAIENIWIEGKLVDPQLFADCVEEVMQTYQQIVDEEPEWKPSYSEIFFAVGMLCFARCGVEVIVLETSCGGRFDMTNIIPTPEVTLLTPLTRDHTDILGDTIPEIAWHKAGIIKPGSRVFSTVTDSAAQKVFNKEAQEQDVKITFVTPEREFEIAMPGRHQQVNAAGVHAALMAMEINEKTIEAGIAEARMPARLEDMPQGNAEPRVIIDGAHSPGKMQALLETLTQEDDIKMPQVHLIFAAKETKSVDDILLPLSPILTTATMTRFQLQGFGSVDPGDAADTLRRINPDVPCEVIPDAQEAVENVLERANPADIVLITGSLYLAGILRERWYPSDNIVKQRTAFPI